MDLTVFDTFSYLAHFSLKKMTYLTVDRSPQNRISWLTYASSCLDVLVVLHEEDRQKVNPGILEWVILGKIHGRVSRNFAYE